MEFWVYENWQAGPHKAVIHRGSCGHCNYGRGKAGGYDRRHAQWHGPFASVAAAQAFSRGLRGVVLRRLSRCVGQISKPRGRSAT
jgi:hypothetical protein